MFTQSRFTATGELCAFTTLQPPLSVRGKMVTFNFFKNSCGGSAMSIEQTLENHQERLMAIPGVTGVGIGNKDNKPVIVVMTTASSPQIKAMLPQTLDGHPVVMEPTGEISAF